MNSVEVFKMQTIKKILSNIAQDDFIKALVGGFFVAADWVFPIQIDLVFIVYALMVFDSITGFWVALKKDDVSSEGVFKIAPKAFIYFILLATSSLVDKVLPLNFCLNLTVSFLAVTEAISILENVSKLGFPIPQRVLKKLKAFHK